jgi:hypothetical protein
MKLTITQENASQYLVNIWQTDAAETDRRDDDALVSSQLFDDDEHTVIELQPGQYVSVDPVEGE